MTSEILKSPVSQSEAIELIMDLASKFSILIPVIKTSQDFPDLNSKVFDLYMYTLQDEIHKEDISEQIDQIVRDTIIMVMKENEDNEEQHEEPQEEIEEDQQPQEEEDEEDNEKEKQEEDEQQPQEEEIEQEKQPQEEEDEEDNEKEKQEEQDEEEEERPQEEDNEDEDKPQEEQQEHHVKYIVGENGLLDVESDDEKVIDDEEILGLKDQYGDEVIEKVIRFHKYTNVEIDDHLDYLREISFVYLTNTERKEVSKLYNRFKKRHLFGLLKQLFKLIDLVIGKNKKKIVSYFLYYVLSRTLQTTSVRNAAKLYISSHKKMVEFKENEDLDLEEFLMFDNRPLPKIEKVLYNL